MGVQAVIFDFWGTLVEQGTYSPIRQTVKILRVHDPLSQFVPQLEEIFMTRTFPDQATGFKELCAKFNVPPKPFIIDQLIGIWNKNRLLAKTYPETMQALVDLKKKGLKLALVSNSDCFGMHDLIKRFEMDQIFDEISLSFETGMLKNNPTLLPEILKKLKVKKENALFVGDSFETDIASAEAAGIPAVLVDRKGKREYDKIVQDLTQLERYLS